MLFGPQITPPSVSDKWPAWYVLIFLLVTLAVMKMITVDLISAMLTILMIVLAYLIVRNKMESAHSIVMIYAVLCILNFVFDLVPLIMSLHGRTSVQDGRTHTQLKPGVERVQVTRIFRTTSFFDPHQGFKYNLQSISLILSPLTALMGAILSLKAVYDIQQWNEDNGPMFADERRDEHNPLLWNMQAGPASRPGGDAQPDLSHQGQGQGQRQFVAFAGLGHRLSPPTSENPKPPEPC